MFPWALTAAAVGSDSENWFFAKKYVPVFHLVEDSHLFFFLKSCSQPAVTRLRLELTLKSFFFFFHLVLKGLSCFMIYGKVEVGGWIG